MSEIKPATRADTEWALKYGIYYGGKLINLAATLKSWEPMVKALASQGCLRNQAVGNGVCTVDFCEGCRARKLMEDWNG